MAFSPNGRMLASASGDNTIKLWDLEKGGEPLTLTGHQGGVTDVAFSPDGRTLASGSGDNTIKLWDLEKGGEPLTLSGHRGFVGGFAYSPVGARRAYVTSVAFSPDGQTLAQQQ